LVAKITRKHLGSGILDRTGFNRSRTGARPV
jgi:hypothetical protein